jgi:hypothetical protein
MHSKFLIQLVVLVATASAAALAEPDKAVAVESREVDGASAVEQGLEKRACKSNGCKCRKGTPQGQYCGMCLDNTGFVIAPNWGTGGKSDHKYECNPQGGCCDYGFSYDCDEGRIYCNGWGG